jgi:uncharacterized Zn-binding protein involved in type VI secretion
MSILKTESFLMRGDQKVGQPAARLGDKIVGTDIHVVVLPPPASPAPLPHPFNGIINDGVSTDVLIGSLAAAVVGSTAINTPPHIPTPPGTSFVNPPTNQATIISGSPTVFIDGKPAARNGDQATTCNDPVPLPVGTVVAVCTVLIG